MRLMGSWTVNFGTVGGKEMVFTVSTVSDDAEAGPGSTCSAGGENRIVMRQFSGRSHSADRSELLSEDE